MNGPFWDFMFPLFGIPLSTVSGVVFWRAVGIAPGKPVTWWIETAVMACTYGGIFNTILGAVTRDLAYATGSAIIAVAAACAWFWRKRRDRIKALIGAKSRALRDALTARMLRPRPVLQGGAP